MPFLIRLLLNGLAIVIAAQILPGLHIWGPKTAIASGILLGFVNAIVRPVLVILTLPLTILTLGLFIFVVNGLCLGLVAWLLPGFWIDTWLDAFLGALIVSALSWLVNGFLMAPPRHQQR